MQLSVVAVGRKMPAWVDTAVSEYQKRLPRQLHPRWLTVALGKRQGKAKNSDRSVQREGERMLEFLPPRGRVIALDRQGSAWTTEKLADNLRQWQMTGEPVSLMVGGPDGLAAQCLERADQRWSLGPLTLPHPLVRVILAEQLYRAWTITVNHPYHRP